MKNTKNSKLFTLNLIVLILFFIGFTNLKAAKTENNDNNKLTFLFKNCAINSDLMLFISSELYKKNFTSSFSKTKSKKKFSILISNKKIKKEKQKNLKLISHLVQPIFITVNHVNEIKNISKEQLNKIITGKIKYWSFLSSKTKILPKLRIHLYAPIKNGFVMKKFFSTLNNKNTESFNQFTYFRDNEEVIQITQFDPNSLSLTTTANLNDKLKILPFENENVFKEVNKKQFINQNYKLLMHYYIYKNTEISKQKQKIITDFFSDEKNIKTIKNKYNFFTIKQNTKTKLGK